MSETAKELFQAGRLADAIQALNAEVKANPNDMNRRGLLAEFLCFDGNAERADLMLDVIVKTDPSVALGVSLFRQQVRAEIARIDFFHQGRPPEFVKDPPEHAQLLIKASIAIREGKLGEAAVILAEAEEKRPKVSGTADGKDFDDFRDLDDRTAGVFEVLTSTGKYYWIPIEQVETLEFRPPQRPRDLIWRAAHMVVTDGGPDGEVYLPAIYAMTTGGAVDERVKLGRVTDWVGGEGEPVRGVGQRSFLIGEEVKPIMQIESVTFAIAGG